VIEHEPPVSGEDLRKVAYDIAESHRRGDLTREDALAELARRCPGFQNSEYELAFLRGLIETR
jgi:hypothetical protein